MMSLRWGSSHSVCFILYIPGSVSSRPAAFHRRPMVAAMAVSCSDSSLCSLQAYRVYLGHLDAPDRPMSPTVDAQCNR